MTYAEATQQNTALKASHIVPKQFAEGVNLRWIQDTEGSVGYMKATRPDVLLIHYPTKVTGARVHIAVRSWPIDAWRAFKKL